MGRSLGIIGCLLVGVALIAFGGTAPDEAPSSENEAVLATSSEATSSEAASSEAASAETSFSEAASATSSGEASARTSKAATKKTASKKKSSTSLYTWKASVAPNYVKVIGKAKVSKQPKRGKIVYSSLDKLGRTRTARGTITYKLVAKSAGWRETMPDISPSGWPSSNERVSIKLANGRSYNGWMWNRSHLIADSLGGKAQLVNLVTGTRTQNVGANDGNGGMAYCETRVRNWLYAHHKGSVYYRARPVYKGSELLCRSVVVDMKSSDGTIDQRVVVYNAANGYKINYKSGGFSKTKATSY